MGIQAFVYQEVSQMDVSVASEVSWQSKLFKLHGMSPVLSKVACFCMLFVFCHRISHSKIRAFSVSSGSYFLPLKIIVVGNFVWSQCWVHWFNFILLLRGKRNNGRRSSIFCIKVWRHGIPTAPAVEELWTDSLPSGNAFPVQAGNLLPFRCVICWPPDWSLLFLFWDTCQCTRYMRIYSPRRLSVCCCTWTRCAQG